MERPNLRIVPSAPNEDQAVLWLRLEALQGTVDDVRSAALVVSNLARHKGDRTLEQLAEGLQGVHATLSVQYSDAVRALRRCLKTRHEDRFEAPRPAPRIELS